MKTAATAFVTIGLFIGVTGMLFRVMHWPWAVPIQIFGSCLLIIGIILIFIYLMVKKS